MNDLTTNTFLNTFKRFIARRGKPLPFHSDNATTFVGANHEMKIFLKQVLTQRVFYEYFTSVHITWHYIPPRSPHFGGIWESVVGAIKYNFRRVIDNIPLTYEEFSTIMLQVEACLNSRSLSPLTYSPKDLNLLTSSHSWIGSSLLFKNDSDLEDLETDRYI